MALQIKTPRLSLRSAFLFDSVMSKTSLEA
jgi:hypothetical protein